MTTTENLADALRDCIDLQRTIGLNDNETATLRNSIAALAAYDAEQATPAAPIRMVVTLEGGMVQWIGSDSSQRIEVAVIDYDDEGADDDELADIPQDDGSTADALARIEDADRSSPAFIAAAFAAITEKHG